MESAKLLNVMRLEEQFCILALNAVCWRGFEMHYLFWSWNTKQVVKWMVLKVLT